MMTQKTFLLIDEYFSEIDDPRKDKGKRHKLTDIIAIAVCAAICGANKWTEVVFIAKEKKKWLKRFLELPYGIPSHDTFSQVFRLINPNQFEKCFIDWVQASFKLSEEDSIAIDGKYLKGSRDQESNTSAIVMVSAFATEYGIVLGQEKVDDKSNEITAIPKLLELLKVKGKTITIDAMGCQREIAKLIREAHAHYVLSLKENHPSLFRDIDNFFKKAFENNFKGIKHSFHETDLEKRHGRREKRFCHVVSIKPYIADKEFHGALDWQDFETIVCVESEVTKVSTGEVSRERRYFISSLDEDAEKILKVVRKHWAVENLLHWTLDVDFEEDKSRSRKDFGAENFSIVRRCSLNLLRAHKAKTEEKITIQQLRLRAAMNNQCLHEILTAQPTLR